MKVTIPIDLISDDLFDFANLDESQIEGLTKVKKVSASTVLTNGTWIKDNLNHLLFLQNPIEYNQLLDIKIFITMETRTWYKEISSECLRNLLTSYRKIVDNGDGEKIPYDTWRTIVGLSKRNEKTKLVKMEDGLLLFIVNTTHKYSAEKAFIPSDYQTFINMLLNDKIENKKGATKTMNIPAMNIDFGPVSANVATMSPYGIAIVTKDGRALVYHDEKIVEVTGMTFNMPKMIYKVPVAIKDVKIGDYVLHNGKPVYVCQIFSDNTLDVVDLIDSENKNVVPITNIFGFNFITKIACPFNFPNTAPSPDQPFGNIMPMIAASMLFGDDEPSSNGNMDLGKMMMISAMCGNGANPFGSIFNSDNTTKEDK